MPYNTYPYELPPLPYAYDALEPFIDTETMHYHHDKHFQNYVNGLNEALKPYPKLQRLTLEQLLSYPWMLPDKARTQIIHNGGGVYNHTLYFNGLAPAGEGVHEPKGWLLTMLNRTYGSFDGFKKAFNEKALAVFGSGYTYLVISPSGLPKIINVKNQDTLLPRDMHPVLLVDVWEHAYYLKYKNLRAEYLNNIWNVITFPDV